MKHAIRLGIDGTSEWRGRFWLGLFLSLLVVLHALEMAALLVLLLAGLLVPVPVLMLHIVEALVQAYIFGMLALIYIAGGMQSREQANAVRKGTPK